MKPTLIVAMVVLLATAVATTLFKSDYVREKKEPWLWEMMLTELHGYRVQPSDLGENITYKMDKVSYDVLDPIGIACQRMTNEYGQMFDVVIIAGDSMNAFHDQQICFNAQGWDIKEMKGVMLESEYRGQVPISMMTITRDDGPEQYAAYFFRSPSGFVSYNRAKIDFFMHRLKKGKPGMGFSYRFIGLSPDMTEEDVTRFATQYLDKLYETTDGEL